MAQTKPVCEVPATYTRKLDIPARPIPRWLIRRPAVDCSFDLDFQVPHDFRWIETDPLESFGGARFRILKRRFVLPDRSRDNVASALAAGLFKDITFHKSWQGSEERCRFVDFFQEPDFRLFRHDESID
jgi:hypothetical protein